MYTAHTFGRREVVRLLTGLDFGLKVRLQRHSGQGHLFNGPKRQQAQQLASELAQELSAVRVYSYGVRAQLEEVSSAVFANVESGSWSYARRAALDLAGILGYALRRKLVDAQAERAQGTAHRLADLCVTEVR